MLGMSINDDTDEIVVALGTLLRFLAERRFDSAD
jgi:hypothetical protein